MPQQIDRRRIAAAGIVLLGLLLGARLAIALPPLLLIAVALVLGALILQRLGIGLRALLGPDASAAEWRYALKYVPAVMITSFGLAYLSLALLYAVAPDAVAQRVREMSRAYQGLHFIVLALVAAPVFEELLFRGMLFPLLALRWGAAAAMLVSAFVFGLFHLNVLGATVFGLAATVFYLRTSSLLVPMGAHFFNNAIAVGLALALPSPEAPPELTQEALRTGLWPALAMTLFGGYFVLRLLRRNWPPGLPAPFRARP